MCIYIGTLQNYARKHQIPIDLLDLTFKVMKNDPVEAPDDGVYIHGMFIEGARWDRGAHILEEQHLKQLTDVMPIVSFFYIIIIIIFYLIIFIIIIILLLLVYIKLLYLTLSIFFFLNN